MFYCAFYNLLKFRFLNRLLAAQLDYYEIDGVTSSAAFYCWARKVWYMAQVPYLPERILSLRQEAWYTRISQNESSPFDV